MHRPISAVREYAIADLTDATLLVEKKTLSDHVCHRLLQVL